MTAAKNEPIVVRAAIVAAVTAAIHAAVVLGYLGITPDQEATIAGLVDMLGTAILVVWSRGAVTPVLRPSEDDESDARLVAVVLQTSTPTVFEPEVPSSDNLVADAVAELASLEDVNGS